MKHVTAVSRKPVVAQTSMVTWLDFKSDLVGVFVSASQSLMGFGQSLTSSMENLTNFLGLSVNIFTNLENLVPVIEAKGLGSI